jgi:hypothetical protein
MLLGAKTLGYNELTIEWIDPLLTFFYFDRYEVVINYNNELFLLN